MHCPHSGSTVSVRGNRTEGAHPPAADLRPTGYGGWTTVDAVNPCPQLRRFTGQANLDRRRSPTRTAACIRPAYPYPMRGDRGSRTQPCTVLQTVANPVGFNRRWRPFRTLGRTPAPLPDRPVPTRRVNRHVGTVARHTDVHEAREGEPRIPYGRHSGTRRGVGGVPEWDRHGSPPRIRTSNKRLQRPMCYRLHQRGIMGRAGGVTDGKDRGTRLIRHRSRSSGTFGTACGWR